MEKANAIFKYRRLNKITTLFRFMEMFVFLVLISRFPSQLPSAVKVFGDHFRGITFTVLSPKFVFVIGNIIILILFLKSRVPENSHGNGKSDLCYDYVKSCDRSLWNGTSTTTTVTSAPTATIVTVPSNKRMICRSRSENPIRAKIKDNLTNRELRRSVTEIGRSNSFGDGCEGTAVAEKDDELSNDDFRRTVDAFIARRQKMLRDEEFSPMVYIGS